MHVSFGIMLFSSYMPKIGIAGSYGNFTFRKGTSFDAKLHFFFPQQKFLCILAFLESFLNVNMDSSPLYCP